ncbi:hypothetical protein BAE44_0008356 [Dichanthelium oligosanthes]|uniref:F-box domain-containing protein n=1 Tax=Dichanthelium oligosanthes TaxID=888268 RepID=A0A1E5VZS2_9POAL|nr:hypothetical protein BAE44_0008356 [Dichanthelium oligosanthes]
MSREPGVSFGSRFVFQADSAHHTAWSLNSSVRRVVPKPNGDSVPSIHKRTRVPAARAPRPICRRGRAVVSTSSAPRNGDDGTMELLPEDVLADVLARLAPRALAVSCQARAHGFRGISIESPASPSPYTSHQGMEDPPPALLPDDVLADVLARLAPRSLAVSRCVCREWRAIVDARCHLRADLLGGMFILTNEPEAPPYFFVRPSMARKIAAGELETYVKMEHCHNVPDVEDSCNGLLLVEERVVVNPATRQWTRLPPCPAGGSGLNDVYLVFDPHYRHTTRYFP